MQETNESEVTMWKRPLRGWLRLLGWTTMLLVLSVLAWLILLLTSESWVRSVGPLSFVFSAGIGVALTLGLALLFYCFSSWRNFRRLCLVFGCIIGAIVLFYSVEHARGRFAWWRFKTQWEAKGEKFDFKAFIPPPVPDDQNFAFAPVVAGSYSHILDRNGHRIEPANTNIVNRLRMPQDAGDGGPMGAMGNWQKALTSDLQLWQEYYRDLAQTTNLFPVAPEPGTPATDVLMALSQYDATIEELRQAAALPASRFPLNYDNEEVYAILLPHLAPMKGCATLLRLRALAELEAGQSDKALADITLALRLIDKLHNDTFLITHLVRIAMLQITQQSIWEGLVNHRWTDAQLVELDRQLATINFAANYQEAMRSEIAFQAAAMDYLRRHPERLCDLDALGFGEDGAARLPNFPLRFIPSGWIYQNAIHSSTFVLKYFLPVGDAAGMTFSPALAKRGEETLANLRLTPYNAICKVFLPALGNSARKFAQAQASVNLSRATCALERHRLARGKYPEKLDDVAPQFITSFPRDPIDGQPLRYVPADGNRFVLYSVGWNEMDDGGQVFLTHKDSLDASQGDWVWRFPDPPSE